MCRPEYGRTGDRSRERSPNDHESGRLGGPASGFARPEHSRRMCSRSMCSSRKPRWLPGLGLLHDWGEQAGCRELHAGRRSRRDCLFCVCKQEQVQESCIDSVATGRRSGSARRKVPGTETKAPSPGGREVASVGGRGGGGGIAEDPSRDRDRSCHPMARLTSTQHQQCTLAVDEGDCRTS